MAIKYTVTSSSSQLKAATTDILVEELPNIGDTLELPEDPLQKVVDKKFIFDMNYKVIEIEFTLEPA